MAVPCTILRWPGAPAPVKGSAGAPGACPICSAPWSGTEETMASGVERVCVVIGRTRHKMVQIEIQEAAKRGARLIELRLDYLAKAPDFKRLLANKPCPLVATARRPSDGGRFKGSEEDRLTLLRQAIVSGFRSEARR